MNVSAQLNYSHSYFLKFPQPVVCLFHSVMEWSLSCNWNNKCVIKNNILTVIKLAPVTVITLLRHNFRINYGGFLAIKVYWFARTMFMRHSRFFLFLQSGNRSIEWPWVRCSASINILHHRKLLLRGQRRGGILRILTGIIGQERSSSNNNNDDHSSDYREHCNSWCCGGNSTDPVQTTFIPVHLTRIAVVRWQVCTTYSIFTIGHPSLWS